MFTHVDQILAVVDDDDIPLKWKAEQRFLQEIRNELAKDNLGDD